ncbi:MAG TPA: histidine kinase [Anaerolineae bacterium]|nr:histidine kinase [Anaerolineae bacterium]
MSAPAQRTQSQLIISLTNYTLFIIVTLRTVITYAATGVLPLLLALLAVFLLLLITEPMFTRRWKAYRLLYLSVQMALAVVISRFAPQFDFLWSLYIILAIQAFDFFARRTALIWTGVMIGLAGAGLLTAMDPALGFAILLNLSAVGYFLVAFTRVSRRAEEARNESAVLLNDLQLAHAQLQDYADRAEELSAARERNRVARELHDSVNQSIFSITLTAEATRTVLDRDPGRVVSYLDQLQEMTSNALAQLRSLIGQLRPKTSEVFANDPSAPDHQPD